jgi:hypothetical protein
MSKFEREATIFLRRLRAGSASIARRKRLARVRKDALSWQQGITDD